MRSEAMDDVAGVIGVDLAMVLAARRGGRTLHIPSSTSKDKVLHLILGCDAAAALIAEMGGMSLQLPTLRELDQHRRNELICRLAARGLPRTDIAAAAGVTHRHVGRIVRAEQELVEAYRQSEEPLGAAGA